MSRRSSLKVECEHPGAVAPRPGRYCTGWGGDARLRASVGQDANTKCSGCSTCVTSSKTPLRPINMRLVAHATGKRPFFWRESCSGGHPAPHKPPEIPKKYPYKSRRSPARLTLWRRTRYSTPQSCINMLLAYRTASLLKTTPETPRKPPGIPRKYARNSATISCPAAGRRTRYSTPHLAWFLSRRNATPTEFVGSCRLSRRASIGSALR